MRLVKKSMALVLTAALVVASFVPGNAGAAKKPSLSKKSVSIAVGKSVKVKVKNAAKNAKVNWKTSKKAVAKIGKKVTKGKKAYATIIGVSAGSAKITAVYKAGKLKKSLKCNVTVTGDEATVNPQGGTATQPSGTNAPAGVPTKAPGGDANPANTQAPATSEPEPTATARATRTPRVTAEPPTASPVPTKAPDVSAPANMTEFTTNSDGIATMVNGKLVVNDTRSEGATEIYVPLPGPVSYGETITIVVKGTADADCPGFRIWIGSGPHRGMTTPKSFTNLSGAFNEKFTVTAFTQEEAQSNNIGSDPINMLTIKSTGAQGPVITGLTIDSINIYYTERGAVVP